MNHNHDIDWEDVENKISIICYKFSNLEPWHDDLAQELRIHAYYVSDDYYNLYRRAIDFWRSLQSRRAPEIPYFDLDICGGSYTSEKEFFSQFDDIISLIRKELTGAYQNKWEKNKMDLALKILDIILDDIDSEKKMDKNIAMSDNSSLNHYINHRINLSWLAEELSIGYKQIVTAMKLLEEVVRGLHAMHKIEIPLEYFEGYYE